MPEMWLFYEVEDKIAQCFLSRRKMVSMNKEKVVELMTEYINEMNRDHGYKAGMPVDEIEHAVATAAPEIARVHGELYDLLVQKGVIVGE